MMKKIFNSVKAVLSASYVKYVVVLAIGIAIIGFVGDSSLWAHYAYRHQIGELQDEIDHYESEYRRDQAQIRQLQNNPKAMERIARERYFMKNADEDIYVLSDDEPRHQFNDPANESIE